MTESSAIFYPLKPAKSLGKSRNAFIFNIVLFYIIVLVLLAFIGYAILHPSAYFQSKWAFFPLYLIFGVVFQYMLTKPPLPHQWNKSFIKKLTYTLNNDELVIAYANRPIFKIRYDEMTKVEVLQEKIEDLTGVRTVGKEFYLSDKYVLSSSKKYPNLKIYATTLQEGIVIHCPKYETIFITPENKDAFQEQLEKRIANKKS